MAVAGAFGFILFVDHFGWAALRPTNLDWLMRGDWGQHLLGWLMFRNAPWELPLGAVPNLAHPLGTTVGYTDSLPLVSVLLKPFSGLLPERFQFIGPWLAACFTLQGATGALLTSAFTARRLPQAFGGMLFALSPVLSARVGHDTLCAHFLLLAVLWLGLRPEGSVNPRRTLLAATALVLLSAAVHPTLWLMTLALAVAVVWRLRRVEAASWKLAGAALGAVLVGSGAMLYLLGYLGSGVAKGGGGFGLFNADLLTLVNPRGVSRIIPTLPSRPDQHEGFGYLGLGVLLLGVYAVVIAVQRRRMGARLLGPAVLPFAVISSALGVFALASVWTVAGHEVVGLRSVYAPLEPLIAPFRSSGRFIWPLHYLVTACAIGATVRWLPRRPRLAGAILAGALVVQLAELHRGKVATEPNPGWFALRSPQWGALAEGRQHLVLFPPVLKAGGGETCSEEQAHPDDLYLSAGFFAYQHRLTVNSAYLARLDGRSAIAYCERLGEDVRAGRFDPRALYLVAAPYRALFANAGLHCEEADGQLGCVVSKAAQGP